MICDVFIEEKASLFNLHDGNVTLDLNATGLLEESEKKVMTEEDQKAYGSLVSKADLHVGGVMTIGYAALIIAHLVKGNSLITQMSLSALKSQTFEA